MTSLQFELLSNMFGLLFLLHQNLICTEWRLQIFSSVSSCRWITDWKAFYYPLISLSFSFSSMVAVINVNRSLQRVVELLYGKEVYSGVVLVLHVRKTSSLKWWRIRKGYFLFLSGMEKWILFFFLVWHKSGSLNCVFFFDFLNVHFLVSLYFLMYSDIPQFCWRPDRKERNGKQRQLENW